MEQKNNKTAVVLGGTVPHGELIKLLKYRGYRTVLVDYFDNPPASQYADIHCKESAMDYDAVKKIAKQYGADLVLSSCLDQQMNIAMKVAEDLNLKHPFSSETAKKVTNKRLMKQIMIENGIPTAKYYVVDETVDLSGIELEFPIIVKPDDSCGSAGITKIKERDDYILKEAIRKACHFGFSGKAIVEEYIEGTEMGVHGYVENGKTRIILCTCKISIIEDNISKQLCNLYIPHIQSYIKKKLEDVMRHIVDAFDLPNDTPLFMQTIIRDGEVYVIEFSPRVAGGTTSGVAKEYAGFDLIDYSIESYIGIKKERKEVLELSKYVCCFPIYVKPGIFGEIEGCKELLSDGVVAKSIMLKQNGTEISNEKPSSANVMKYIIDGSTIDECFNKMMEADQRTEIYDMNGMSMKEGNSRLTYKLLFEKIKVLL